MLPVCGIFVVILVIYFVSVVLSAHLKRFSRIIFFLLIYFFPHIVWRASSLPLVHDSWVYSVETCGNWESLLLRSSLTPTYSHHYRRGTRSTNWLSKTRKKILFICFFQWIMKFHIEPFILEIIWFQGCQRTVLVLCCRLKSNIDSIKTLWGFMQTNITDLPQKWSEHN